MNQKLDVMNVKTERKCEAEMRMHVEIKIRDRKVNR